jgi:hypothetical protein
MKKNASALSYLFNDVKQFNDVKLMNMSNPCCVNRY